MVRGAWVKPVHLSSCPTYLVRVIFLFSTICKSEAYLLVLTIFSAQLLKKYTKCLSLGGIKVRKLKSERLQEASRKNEAAVYRLFDDWLNSLEPVLEKEDRTLLLLFDEFEKLEEAERAKYLNLNLLLDWFRSVIQNRSRLALLFSGVRSFGEMGAHWAGYFVNVQTLE